MSPERAYLDHNATSPLRPEARAAMLEAMDLVGNPSSIHAEGRAAKVTLERARLQVASLVGAKPEQVVFTSGGTEALNIVVGTSGAEVLRSAIEHDAVLATARFIAPQDEEIQSGPDGRIGLEKFEQKIHEPYWGGALLVLQFANNETGVLQPVSDLVALADRVSHPTLTDAVQAAGKCDLNFQTLGVTYLVVSGHKIGGPKGVGAVVSCADPLIHPQIFGGGQERRMRGGTENLVGIAGFGAAAEAAQRDLDDFAKLANWRDELETAVAQQTPDAVVIAQQSPRLPNTSCIALPGVPAETLVMALDLEGVAVSAGSACSSGKVTRSHVLEAMGLGNDISGSAIRVSLGWNSSKKHVNHFLKAWATVTDRLARS